VPTDPDHRSMLRDQVSEFQRGDVFRCLLINWPFRMKISLLSVWAELEKTESSMNARRKAVLQKRKSNKYEN
jgi:hypothetical protein